MSSIRTRTVEPDVALFERYRASGDVATRNDLVLRYRWLSRRCAASMCNRGVPMNDLVQVAEIGLIKAVERYDPNREVAFASFASPTVMGEIRRHFRDKTWSVSVPRRAKELRGLIRTATDELNQSLGRCPTPDEIAAHCALDATTVVDTQFAEQLYRCSSLGYTRDGTGDTFEGHSVASNRTGDPLAAAELRVESLRAIAELPERSQKIILWRFYEDCTQREIGERLGVGQVQVSRLLRAAIEELRERLTGDTQHPARVDHRAASDSTLRADNLRADNLGDAFASRIALEQAKGMLAEREHMERLDRDL